MSNSKEPFVIEYYHNLKEVDEDLIKIQEWQEKKINKIYARTEKKIHKALAKLGAFVPQEIKDGR